MVTYKIINKDGGVEAEVIGSTALAMTTAVHYHTIYKEEGNMQLKADNKVLIDFLEEQTNKQGSE